MTNIAKSTGMALGVLGFLLAIPNADATWYADNLPEKAWPWSIIQSRNNSPILFAIGSATGALYSGFKYNGIWYSQAIYSVNNAQARAVSTSYLEQQSPALDVYDVAHLDADGMVRLTWYSIFTGWNTLPQPIDTGTTNPGATVATRVHGGKLYIFYTSTSQNGTDTLKVATYNGQVAHQTLDGSGGPDGRTTANMYQPTVVEAGNSLYVYYYDATHHTLREAYSADGMNWTRFQAVDGPGVLGGVGDQVGALPAAIVYKSNNISTINVFYTDLSNNKLRIAQRVVGAMGPWDYGWVDAIDVGSHKAPVIHGDEMQVYYVSAGKLRAAYGTGPGALLLATLDGGEGGFPTGIAIGSVSDPMGPYATAVEATTPNCIVAEGCTGPSVFYWDSNNGDLRNAYWP